MFKKKKIHKAGKCPHGFKKTLMVADMESVTDTPHKILQNLILKSWKLDSVDFFVEPALQYLTNL